MRTTYVIASKTNLSYNIKPYTNASIVSIISIKLKLLRMCVNSAHTFYRLPPTALTLNATRLNTKQSSHRKCVCAAHSHDTHARIETVNSRNEEIDKAVRLCIGSDARQSLAYTRQVGWRACANQNTILTKQQQPQPQWWRDDDEDDGLFVICVCACERAWLCWRRSVRANKMRGNLVRDCLSDIGLKSNTQTRISHTHNPIFAVYRRTFTVAHCCLHLPRTVPHRHTVPNIEKSLHSPLGAICAPVRKRRPGGSHVIVKFLDSEQERPRPEHNL